MGRLVQACLPTFWAICCLQFQIYISHAQSILPLHGAAVNINLQGVRMQVQRVSRMDHITGERWCLILQGRGVRICLPWSEVWQVPRKRPKVCSVSSSQRFSTRGLLIFPEEWSRSLFRNAGTCRHIPVISSHQYSRTSKFVCEK
jgi:hypothetical protein